MTYDLPNGRTLVLSYHSAAYWAEERRLRLLSLGCSPAYADAYADLIRRAVLR